MLAIVLFVVLQKEVPVIFLPTHRSHLDYILLTFVLFNYNIKAPYVAAGENLLIPFFGLVIWLIIVFARSSLEAFDDSYITRLFIFTS